MLRIGRGPRQGRKSLSSGGTSMEFNLADLFESVADSVPDQTALVAGDRRLTYAELDRRANRLAHHLTAAGVGPGDRFGVQLSNGTEYLEAMLACFKVRAVPINVNYRYVAGELAYLYRDAGLVGIAYHRRFGPAVAAAMGATDDVNDWRAVLAVDDGSGTPTDDDDYEAALAARSEERGFGPRRADDRLLRLHRGHHRHAQGRGLAARRHLLRRHGRGRSAVPGRSHHHGRGARRRGCCTRGSPPWPSPPTCTPPGTGWPSPRCSGAARWSPCRAGSSTRRRCGAWWRPSGPTPWWWWATPWPARSSTAWPPTPTGTTCRR